MSDPDGRTLRAGDVDTHYHDVGEGPPVLLLHGSGPGVSAWANWRLVIEALAPRFRVVAPDLAGFGESTVPPGTELRQEQWVGQVLGLLDALELERVALVGNSLGGSLALALAIEHPERVDRLVLMGSVGVPFEITDGLEAVWGYEPSLATMGRLMRQTFAYDPTLVTDELVRMRYEATVRPGAQETFANMFPAPRQQWVDALGQAEEDVRAIAQPTLLVHGRDDKVIPLASTLTLLDWIDDSRAHIFGRCGHWTQIERASEFTALVSSFLDANLGPQGT